MALSHIFLGSQNPKKSGIYIYIYNYIYIYIYIYVATHFSQPFPKPHFLLARRGSHLPRGPEQRPWDLWQIPCLRQSDVSVIWVICLQGILKMNRTYKYLNPRFGVRYGSGNGLMEDFILRNLHQICQTASVSGQGCHGFMMESHSDRFPFPTWLIHRGVHWTTGKWSYI